MHLGFHHFHTGVHALRQSFPIIGPFWGDSIGCQWIPLPMRVCTYFVVSMNKSLKKQSTWRWLVTHWQQMWRDCYKRSMDDFPNIRQLYAGISCNCSNQTTRDRVCKTLGHVPVDAVVQQSQNLFKTSCVYYKTEQNSVMEISFPTCLLGLRRQSLQVDICRSQSSYHY